MPVTPSPEGFLRAVVASTGRPALSEAKMLRIAAGAPEIVTVTEGEDIVGVGVAAPHRQPDRSDHWAVETAVRPDLAFVDFEEVVLQRTLEVVPGHEPSVWSSRTSLDAALARLGFVEVRRLLHMTVPLPLASASGPAGDPADEDVRAFVDADLDAILDVNRRAFADHREAAGLDRAAFEQLASQPWFQRAGLLVAHADDGVAGFCWTKVHPEGDGEIYRIAVDPSRQGAGWGRRLVIAGFGHLAGDPGVDRGTLWVDAANEPAIRLYESIGMTVSAMNAEFERQPNR